MIEKNPDLVRRMVEAYVRAAAFVKEHPNESATIAARYIGVNERFIAKALQANRPNVRAVQNRSAMDQVLSLMLEMRYLEQRPTDFSSLGFLEQAIATCHC